VQKISCHFPHPRRLTSRRISPYIFQVVTPNESSLKFKIDRIDRAMWIFLPNDKSTVKLLTCYSKCRFYIFYVLTKSMTKLNSNLVKCPILRSSYREFPHGACLDQWLEHAINNCKLRYLKVGSHALIVRPPHCTT
jgi:hypothetical protein